MPTMQDGDKIKFIMDAIREFGIHDEEFLGDGFSKIYDMVGTPSLDLVYLLVKKWKEKNG